MSSPDLPAPARALRPALAQEFVARVLAGHRFPELLERIACGIGELGRHLDVDGDEQVSYRPVGPANAFAAYPERPAVGRARRNPHGHWHPAVSGHLDLGPE